MGIIGIIYIYIIIGIIMYIYIYRDYSGNILGSYGNVVVRTYIYIYCIYIYCIIGIIICIYIYNGITMGI